MDTRIVNLIKSNKWNQIIITSYWLICLIYLIGEFVILYLRIRYYPDAPLDLYVRNQIILPNILLGCVMIFTELHHRLLKKYKEEMIILSSILLADIILMTVHPMLGGEQIVLILPLIVTVFYFNIRLLLVTLIADLATFSLLYFLSPVQQQYMTIFGFALVILTLMGTAVAGYGVIRRGEELLKNIENLAKSEEKLFIEKTIMDKLLKVDALTGLYTHMTFHEYTESVMQQADKNGMPLQLALLDIDNFKQINDQYGHRAGDMVLKEIGHIISRDITSEDLAARYGGDEFALVFTGKSLEEAYDIVEQIRKDIESGNFIECNGKKITASIGLHSYSKNEGKEVSFNKTDASLYSAKRSGKNRTVRS